MEVKYKTGKVAHGYANVDNRKTYIEIYCTPGFTCLVKVKIPKGWSAIRFVDVTGNHPFRVSYSFVTFTMPHIDIYEIELMLQHIKFDLYEKGN